MGLWGEQEANRRSDAFTRGPREGWEAASTARGNATSRPASAARGVGRTGAPQAILDMGDRTGADQSYSNAEKPGMTRGRMPLLSRHALSTYPPLSTIEDCDALTRFHEDH